MIRIKGICENSKAISYILVIYILIFSGSGFQVVSARLSSYVLISVTIILLFCYILQKRISSTIFIPILIMLGMFCTLIYTDDVDKIDSYIVLACIIISAYILSASDIRQLIISAYSDVIYILAIIGITCYLLVNAGVKLPFEQVKISDNGLYNYHTVYIYNYIEGLSKRNCGAFWEPGIFASHLILALQCEIFSERKNYIRVFIEIGAIVTCNSSAGFFLLFFVFAELLVMSNNDKYRRTRIIVDMIVLIALLMVVLNLNKIIYGFNLHNNPYVKKLLSDNLIHSSRVLSLAFNWGKFLKSPIFGNGLTNSVVDVSIVNLTPDTTTSLFMLNAFGVFGSIFTILTVKGILSIDMLSWSERILALITILIIFNKETHYIMLSSWFIVFEFSCNFNWKNKIASRNIEGERKCLTQ